MRILYDKDSDMLVIEFHGGPAAETEDLTEEALVDYDERHRALAVTLAYASEYVALDSVEIEGLPQP